MNTTSTLQSQIEAIKITRDIAAQVLRESEEQLRQLSGLPADSTKVPGFPTRKEVCAGIEKLIPVLQAMVKAHVVMEQMQPKSTGDGRQDYGNIEALFGAHSR